MKEHFLLLARYNRWANQRIFDSAELLSEDRLWEDHGAFFGSLMGTLNHLLVGDRLWMARFRGEPAPQLKLDAILYRDLPSLRHAREAEDQGILSTVASLEPAHFVSDLAYLNTRGESCVTAFSPTLAHVFNHQTHHRGQAHTLLGQLGLETPVLDLIYFVRRGEGAA